MEKLRRGIVLTEETKRLCRQLRAENPTGIFLTGIECSDPWVDGRRRNQLVEAFDFPTNFAERLKRVRDLGVSWLRFGVGYSQVHLGPDRFDFELTDRVLELCQKLEITVVANLLHFGLPGWLHQDKPTAPFFQNPEFPTIFADYARVYAERYPHIKYFTPVNEPYVTARYSAKDGQWNEKIASAWSDHRPFIRAAANLAKASILAREAISQVSDEQHRSAEPIFFQNESFEVALATTESGRQHEAEQFNLHRFTTLDLAFGHADPKMRKYLVEEQGFPAAEYDWFMRHGQTRQTVLGIDYYPWSVYELASGGRRPYDPLLTEAVCVLVTDYYKRYQLPLLHMEVNATPEHAVETCQNTYEALCRLAQIGYPILGMTWFGDDLQVGWQSALTGPAAFGEHRVGLFYKGRVEPVAQRYAELIKQGLPEFV